LVIKERQTKITLRFYLTAVKMAIINNTNNSKCWQRYGGKGTLLHCWWECKLAQPLWKSSVVVPQKTKVELPNDPGIPLLDIYPMRCAW
jgi:hypothetical protein